ncbi:MAG: FMN-binding negative transcriptional regulator, partial [Alphaproteobacteria bacterium]|nr:FMN-binding negative transcriptional regulator [Alphaproteobacteria bacterium]
LTNAEEALITNKQPWSVAAVSQSTYASMRQAIVGIDIAITSIDGKAKVGQNRRQDDRAGAIQGLQGLGTPDGLAVAALMGAVEA